MPLSTPITYDRQLNWCWTAPPHSAQVWGWWCVNALPACGLHLYVGLLLCAGGRLLSRDHDVPVLDASTVGDPEHGMEDKGLTSERAFGAQVREATLGDDLSNAVVLTVIPC